MSVCHQTLLNEYNKCIVNECKQQGIQQRIKTYLLYKKKKKQQQQQTNKHKHKRTGRISLDKVAENIMTCLSWGVCEKIV